MAPYGIAAASAGELVEYLAVGVYCPPSDPRAGNPDWPWRPRSCGWRIVIPPKIPEDSPSCYYSSMRNLAVLFIHFIAVLARLLGPGGVRSIVCGVASPQTPAPDRESLQATIAESIRVGPHLCRLDGALGASHSSAPVRNCTEALDTARPPPRHEQAKVSQAILTESPSEVGPKGPSAELIRAVVEMKQHNPNWGCPRIAQQMTLAFNIQIDKDVVRRILSHHYRP